MVTISYRGEFISSVRAVFNDKIRKKKAFDAAITILDDYFNHVIKELNDIQEVSNDSLEMSSLNGTYLINFQDCKLSIEIKESMFYVQVMSPEAPYNDVITLNSKLKYVSQKTNNPLSYELLDRYLSDTFRLTLNKLISRVI
nr:hypothetical protein [Niallia taxi]